MLKFGGSLAQVSNVAPGAYDLYSISIDSFGLMPIAAGKLWPENLACSSERQAAALQFLFVDSVPPDSRKILSAEMIRAVITRPGSTLS